MSEGVEAVLYDGVSSRPIEARVSVRENIGQSHFAIITPGNPVHEANEAAMLAVLNGTQ